MITTYFFNDFFYKTGHTDNELRNYGYPRNDILAKNAGIRKNRDTTNIIWMPTYRQHTKINEMRINYSFPLGIPVIKSADEMKEINFQRHSCISHQMKVVNVGLQPNKLRQD